jgi:hypothetical protein
VYSFCSLRFLRAGATATTATSVSTLRSHSLLTAACSRRSRSYLKQDTADGADAAPEPERPKLPLFCSAYSLKQHYGTGVYMYGARERVVVVPLIISIIIVVSVIIIVALRLLRARYFDFIYYVVLTNIVLGTISLIGFFPHIFFDPWEWAVPLGALVGAGGGWWLAKGSLVCRRAHATTAACDFAVVCFFSTCCTLHRSHRLALARAQATSSSTTTTTHCMRFGF